MASPFEALQDLPLVLATGPHRGVYTLKVGRYGNRRPAFQVLGPQQVPWDTLSTNLPDELLGDDEIHVREHEPCDVRELLFNTGLFEREDVHISSGHVAHYAEVWRLKQGVDGKYLVEDPYRLRNIRLAARAFEDQLLAEEATRRLQGKLPRRVRHG
jgi:hypothetical protein